MPAVQEFPYRYAVTAAASLLAKAEQTCLVVNSLKAALHLEAEVNIVPT